MTDAVASPPAETTEAKENGYRVIGTRVPRYDATDKVTGRAQYGDRARSRPGAVPRGARIAGAAAAVHRVLPAFSEREGVSVLRGERVAAGS